MGCSSSGSPASGSASSSPSATAAKGTASVACASSLQFLNERSPPLPSPRPPGTPTPGGGRPPANWSRRSLVVALPLPLAAYIWSAPGAATRRHEFEELAGRLGLDGLLDDRPARQARGYSQQQLAGMAGVSRQAVSAVEAGHSTRRCGSPWPWPARWARRSRNCSGRACPRVGHPGRFPARGRPGRAAGRCRARPGPAAGAAPAHRGGGRLRPGPAAAGDPAVPAGPAGRVHLVAVQQRGGPPAGRGRAPPGGGGHRGRPGRGRGSQRAGRAGLRAGLRAAHRGTVRPGDPGPPGRLDARWTRCSGCSPRPGCWPSWTACLVTTRAGAASTSRRGSRTPTHAGHRPGTAGQRPSDFGVFTLDGATLRMIRPSGPIGFW